MMAGTYNCSVDATQGGGKYIPVVVEANSTADAMRKAITAAFNNEEFAASEPEEVTITAFKRVPKQTGLFV